MLPRVIRRLNYVKNKALFLPTQETPEFGIVSGLFQAKKEMSTYVKNIKVDKDWKMKEMIKKELEKVEDEGETSKRWHNRYNFSGLVGILFFIAFLYEQQFI